MNTKAEQDRCWRERQRAAGRCLNCGAAKDCPEFMCLTCRAKRNAMHAARKARLRAERLSGGVVSPVFGDRGRRGGVVSGARRGARLAAAAVREARHLLLDVRSDFTAEQMADLDRVWVRLYRLGTDRGYARGRQARYAHDRKASAA